MLIFATMINDVDDRAFMQEVYQQNERLMYAIALKYASNTQDCEDIVHDRQSYRTVPETQDLYPS